MTTPTFPSPERAPPFAHACASASLATVASLFLVACGGNEDGHPSAPPPATAAQLPVSAVATDASLEMFAINLPETDTAEPLALDLVKAMPTSESEDPIATP